MIQYAAAAQFCGNVGGCRMPAGACRRARRRRDPMAGMTAYSVLSPPHVMARENFAHARDDLPFRAGELGRPALAPFLVGGDRASRLGALDQILDLHLAARLLVTALDDHAGRIAAVGIFELVAHVLGIA